MVGQVWRKEPYILFKGAKEGRTVYRMWRRRRKRKGHGRHSSTKGYSLLNIFTCDEAHRSMIWNNRLISIVKFRLLEAR